MMLIKIFHPCVRQITPESASASYQIDLQQWEEEKEREKHEFTITEKDLIQTNPQNKPIQVLLQASIHQIHQPIYNIVVFPPYCLLHKIKWFLSHSGRNSSPTEILHRNPEIQGKAALLCFMLHAYASFRFLCITKFYLLICRWSTGTNNLISNNTLQALPPIRNGSHAALREPTARAEKKAQEEVRRRRPEPPRPKLLHLGVTARSHSLLEYQAQFPSQFSKHHIYRCVQCSQIYNFL